MTRKKVGRLVFTWGGWGCLLFCERVLESSISLEGMVPFASTREPRMCLDKGMFERSRCE